jgi:hypothetical protein
MFHFGLSSVIRDTYRSCYHPARFQPGPPVTDKCPKCEASLPPLALTVPSDAPAASRVLCCPHCEVVLSVQFVPLIEEREQTSGIDDAMNGRR